MSARLTAAFSILPLVAGCSHLLWKPHQPPPTDKPEVTVEGRACTPSSTAYAQAVAVACAEEFVRRNGYTADAAMAAQAVPEAIEWVAFPDPALTERRDTLEARAMTVCKPAGRWLVAFRYRKPGAAASRVVTMGPDFTNLTMDSQDLPDGNLGDPALSCKRLR